MPIRLGPHSGTRTRRDDVRATQRRRDTSRSSTTLLLGSFPRGARKGAVHPLLAAIAPLSLAEVVEATQQQQQQKVSLCPSPLLLLPPAVSSPPTATKTLLLRPLSTAERGDHLRQTRGFLLLLLLDRCSQQPSFLRGKGSFFVFFFFLWLLIGDYHHLRAISRFFLCGIGGGGWMVDTPVHRWRLSKFIPFLFLFFFGFVLLL